MPELEATCEQLLAALEGAVTAATAARLRDLMANTVQRAAMITLLQSYYDRVKKRDGPGLAEALRERLDRDGGALAPASVAAARDLADALAAGRVARPAWRALKPLAHPLTVWE